MARASGDPQFVSSALDRMCEYRHVDTFDQAVDPDGHQISEIVWMADHGSTTATRLLVSETRRVVEDLVTERWPGKHVADLDPETLLALFQEAYRRLAIQRGRYPWRWN
jgi:hypothetical protein